MLNFKVLFIDLKEAWRIENETMENQFCYLICINLNQIL